MNCTTEDTNPPADKLRSAIDIPAFRAHVQNFARTSMFRVTVGPDPVMPFLISAARRTGQGEYVVRIYETVDLLVLDGWLPVAMSEPFSLRVYVYDREGRRETLLHGGEYVAVGLAGHSDLSWERGDAMWYDILLREVDRG